MAADRLRLRAPLFWAFALASASGGCHGGPGANAARAGAALAQFDRAHFSWVAAECNDGRLDLAARGFERELFVAAKQDALALTFETELAAQGCRTTAVWNAKPGNGPEPWRFEPRAVVGVPVDAACGPTEREAVGGVLRLSGDVLEVVTHRSPFCRGFDARFVYRRSPEKPRDSTWLVMRYFAAFNSADADAVAKLFVDGGGLVEPFSKTADGSYLRHEGRDAVRRWYQSAFASTPWLALRLTGIDTGDGPGRLSARWEYMDANLAKPLRGRNLFVVAEGEIYETELQLVDDPSPAVAPEAPAKEQNPAVPTPEAGAKVDAR